MATAVVVPALDVLYGRDILRAHRFAGKSAEHVGLCDVAGEVEAGADERSGRAEAPGAGVSRVGFLTVLEECAVALSSVSLVGDVAAREGDDLVRQGFGHGGSPTSSYWAAR